MLSTGNDFNINWDNHGLTFFISFKRQGGTIYIINLMVANISSNRITST